MRNEATNIKHDLFVTEYQKTGNVTKAALAAGYHPTSAASSGSRLLKDPRIQALIKSYKDKAFNNLVITEEAILAEVAMLAFSRITDMFTVDGAIKPYQDWPDGLKAAISGIEVDDTTKITLNEEYDLVPVYIKKFKLWSKSDALEKLMKNRGMFDKDNQQKSAKITVGYGEEI